MLDTALLYTGALCNLQCTYCMIDKNEALKLVDKEIEKSYQDSNYYITRLKQYFPQKDSLKRIELWGGEPLLRIERVIPLLNQVIQEYNNFNNIYFSTNFSYLTWNTKISKLFELLEAYPDRNFLINLQLSIDGPEEINDLCRGEKTTSNCLNNFQMLLKNINNYQLSPNIALHIETKATLSLDSLNILYNSKDKVISYYKFFEDNFINPIKQLKNPNITIGIPLPNFAVPVNATVEDGKKFAQLAKICDEIEKEKLYFKYYTRIFPMPQSDTQNYLSYCRPSGLCGTGIKMIGFLPNNYLTTCHASFTFLLDDYKNYFQKKSMTFIDFLNNRQDKYLLTDETFKQYQRQILLFGDEHKSTIRLKYMAKLIQLLAKANQIQSKYTDEKWALYGAIYVKNQTNFCVKDNFNETGSISLMPIGIFKLLLNGFEDIAWREHYVWFRNE